MGTAVKCEQSQTRMESKQDMEVATEAAAAIGIGIAEMIAWVGANAEASGRNADIMRALDVCMDRLQQDAAAFELDDFQAVSMTPGQASSLTTLEVDSGFPSGITEDMVLVGYGFEFMDINPNTGDGRPAATELQRGIYTKVRERYEELRKVGV